MIGLVRGRLAKGGHMAGLFLSQRPRCLRPSRLKTSSRRNLVRGRRSADGEDGWSVAVEWAEAGKATATAEAR